MAHSMSLLKPAYKGESLQTINLSSGTNSIVTHYTPAEPQVTTIASLSDQVRDGGEISAALLRNVTETVDLTFTTASKSALQAAIGDVERWIYEAEHHQKTGEGPKVYLYITLDTETYSWQSEILAGRLELGERALDSNYAGNKAEARLHITRRYYWETSSDIEIDMTSSATSPAASTATIYINDNATAAQTNYIQIANTEIIGALPAPVKFEVKNTSGGAVDDNTWYIGQNVFADPANYNPFLLGTANEHPTNGATVSIGAGGEDHSHQQWRWTLSDANITDMAGQHFRVVAAFTAMTSGVSIRANLAYYTGSLYIYFWSNDEVKVTGLAVTTELMDLGTVQIPPNPSGSDLAFILSARYSTTATCTLDFVMLLPITSFRKLKKRGSFSMANSDSFVDDGTNGYVYQYDPGSGDQWPFYVPFGEPIYVWPERTQRVYFLGDTHTGWAAMAGKTYSVQADYRPRRLTIGI